MNMKNKKNILVFFFIVISFIGFSQQDDNITNDKDSIYVYVNQMPEFPGGVKGMMEYINNNINYPYEAQQEGIGGKIYIQFEVKKDGSIGKTKILKSVHPLLDEEALRVVKSLPKFIPGMKEGIPVNVWQSIPIQFKIDPQNIKNETLPVFNFHNIELNKFIESRFHYPEEINDPDVFGEEIVKFHISEDGEVGEVEILKSIHPLIDKETIRLFKSLPKFIPAKRNGISVKSNLTIPLYIGEPIFNSKKSEPDFLDIKKSFGKYIKENTKYPEEALYAGITGKVELIFEITKIGEVGKIHIYSSPHLILAEEAKRVIYSLPKFKHEYLKKRSINTWNKASFSFMNDGIKIEQAKYPEGEPELYALLSEKIEENLKTKKDSGSLVAMFKINVKGDVVETKIIKGINSRIDSVVINTVNSLSGFIPGKVNSEIADTWYSIVFNFSDKTFIYVRQMPEFPGGKLALRKYVAENVEYPALARNNGVQGTIFLRFEVKSTGYIGKVEIQKGVHLLLDNAAIKVVKSLPKFKPGMQNGIPCNVWYSIPVTFKLN